MCWQEKRVKVAVGIFLLLFGLASFILPQDEKELLKMTLEELMNVKITTAARTPEKIGDIPASVVLITRKDIETYGYRTLAEILENVSGFFGIDNYEWGENFGIRGFWSGVPNDNMIILVNGVSQVDDFQSNYHMVKLPIPVEAIDKIEVVRGPMSVIYGNGAFYGVINIFTHDFSQDDEDQNKHRNMVSVSAGSSQTKKLFVRVSGQKNDYNYVFNGSISDTYGMDHPLDKMVRNPSILPEFGVPEDHRTGGRLESNEKYLNFSGSFKKFYIDINHIQTRKESMFLFPSPFDGHLYNFVSSTVSVGYKTKFSDSVSFDGKFNYCQNRVSADYDFFFEDFYGNQQIESNAWEADLNLFINPHENLEIKSGLYYRSVLDDSNMYNLPSFGTPTLVNNIFYLNDGQDIVTRAFFTQVSYKPFSNLNLVAGVRLEQMPKYSLGAILAGGTEFYQNPEATYDQDEIEIIPRFAAIYSINDKHFFKLLYGQAINRPSFFQSTQNLLLTPGRGALEPESIQTFEFNYIATFSKNFTLNASVFRNTLNNLITRVAELNEEGDYITWSANAGKMVTHGVELTINAEPFKNFRLVLSGTFQETEDKRPDFLDIEVAYSPKVLGYMKASYHAKNVTLAVTGNYVGAMETFWDETLENQDGTFGRRIGDRVDGYFSLGANLRIDKLFNTGLYFNLRCSNLLNEEIRYPTFTNNTWADRGTLGIGRTILATIGWKF